MANRWERNGNSGRFYFLGLQNYCGWGPQPCNQKTLAPWKTSYEKPRQHIQKQRHYFANKCPSSQGCGFSSGHLWMWELDCEESWAPKNWCFWNVVLENTLDSPLDCKEIQPPILKEISPEYSLEGHPEAEAPRLWPPDVKNRLIGKDPDAGKDWRQAEKGITEDEMVGWHHQLNGHVWASFGSWWWTGKPDMLQSMGSQSVWLDWVTELRPSLSWWCIFRHSETALYWVLSACLPTYCVGAFPFLRLCCL